jgi:hypothetical protein
VWSPYVFPSRNEFAITDTELKDVLSIDTRILNDDQRAALTPARWKKASLS